MKNIEITDELFGYLEEKLYGDAAEAYYTSNGQFEIALDDFDYIIKRIIEDKDNWEAVACEDKLVSSKVYPWSRGFDTSAREE